MPTAINPSRPRRFTAHRLLPRDPEWTSAMELLALNSAHHLFTSEWSLELCSSGETRTVGLRFDNRFLSGRRGGSEEVGLPDDGICGKRERHRSFVFLPNTIPPHARSLLRGILPLRPAARRRSAFPVPPKTSLRTAAKNAAQTSFGLRPIKHFLGTWEHGPTSLSSDPSKFREFKHGDSPCI